MRMAILLLALAGAGSAWADSPPQRSDCLIVYGQGRNIDEPPQNEAWDRINLRFNTAVTARLRAAGISAHPLVFKVGVTDLATAVKTLAIHAQAKGCSKVVDTAVLADENGTLVVRLRVHPVLGLAGPIAAGAIPHIGGALYTGRSEFDLNARTLDHLDLEALAATMVGDYLVSKSAAAASPSQ